MKEWRAGTGASIFVFVFDTLSEECDGLSVSSRILSSGSDSCDLTAQVVAHHFSRERRYSRQLCHLLITGRDRFIYGSMPLPFYKFSTRALLIAQLPQMNALLHYSDKTTYCLFISLFTRFCQKMIRKLHVWEIRYYNYISIFFSRLYLIT